MDQSVRVKSTDQTTFSETFIVLVLKMFQQDSPTVSIDIHKLYIKIFLAKTRNCSYEFKTLRAHSNLKLDLYKYNFTFTNYIRSTCLKF